MSSINNLSKFSQSEFTVASDCKNLKYQALRAGPAIISVLLNASHPDIDLGPNLSSFKDFSGTFDSSVSTKCLQETIKYNKRVKLSIDVCAMFVVTKGYF